MRRGKAGAAIAALGLLGALLAALPAAAGTPSNWVLVNSTLTYHVSHPLHHVAGVSHAARGKGVCDAGECSFLVAAPVKSFTSGDTNRDLHMLQAVRGAKYPLIVVRTTLPEAELNSPTIQADLVIQFAGQTAELKQVEFHLAREGKQVRLTGTIPATLADFKIPPPELLFVPIENAIPIGVEMTFRRN